jgi:serine phosphatase RsbU (regulator of sigma subunit)
MIQRLYREVKLFVGAVHQADDLTVVVIKRRD